MIKTSKTIDMAMELKLFQKTKYFSFIVHQNSMFYNESISSSSQKIIIKKNSPMIYSKSKW
jgi:hypothetical protein